MSGSRGLANAWDDDWVNVADKSATKPPGPAPKLSKAERRAQHVEQQKQLWDSAENPSRKIWLETQGVVPLREEFRPQVTLLSRKPPPTIIARRDPAAETANADDDPDSEDEARKKREAEFEERTRKAKLEREEKQRRYAEARERIMGSVATTPSSPSANSRENSHGRDRESRRGRGRGAHSSYNSAEFHRRSQPESPAEMAGPAPTLAGSGEQALFDPEDMGRRLTSRRETPTSYGRDDNPLRQPRGPEHSGRGGFGFAPRGGSSAVRQ